MLPHAVRTSTDRLTAAAVRCAWSQWSSIGASTHRSPQVDDEIVDVEALLLGSLGLARREPRLRTLAVDWTMENSRLLSIARVRALVSGPFKGVDLGLGDLAQRISTEGGDARWRALVPKNGTASIQTDSKSQHTSKAMPPRWRGARTLLLQLRRGFGVGVKPDLIAILLGMRDAWVDVSTLGELSRYTVAAVRRAADDMADAGLIDTSHGHNRAYRAHIDAWRSLLPKASTPIWRRRADGFAFVLRWQSYVDGKKEALDSEFSLAVGFGAQMTEFWKLWNEAGVSQEPVSDDPANAWASRNVVIESLVNWFEDRAQNGDEYEVRR